MTKTASSILRVGLGVTFLWVAVFIFKSPEGWGTFIQPWAARLLFIPIGQLMIGVAVFDAVVGIMLLIDEWVWIFALLGVLHLAVVLTVSGITEVTVRDMGLLTGILALSIETLPPVIAAKVSSLKIFKNKNNIIQ